MSLFSDELEIELPAHLGWREKVRNTAMDLGPTVSTYKRTTTSSVSGTRQRPATFAGQLQWTRDQNHGPRLGKLGKRDVGGYFESHCQRLEVPYAELKGSWSFYPSFPKWTDSMSFSGYPVLTSEMSLISTELALGKAQVPLFSRLHPMAVMAHGSTGMARTLPTAPEMSLSTSIVELREGLPRMVGAQLAQRRRPASVGGEYLNYHFGWLPIVNDVQDIIRLTKDYEKIVAQFRRDNGRVVRRRITLVEEEETQTQSIGRSVLSQSYLQTDNLQRVTTRRTKVWGSYAYKLAYPLELDNALASIHEFNRVFGVIPTAELVWDMIPFSFVVDWFANVGDVLRNVSTLGSNLQLHYGYVMAQEDVEVTLRGDYYPYNPSSNRALTVPLQNRYYQSSKRRYRASPFGFGITSTDLTPYQAGIAAALGLSRFG